MSKKRKLKKKKPGPNPQRFCKKGHDTSKCGRYKGGDCKKCKKIYRDNYYKTHKKKYRENGEKWKRKNKKKWLNYQKEYNKIYQKKYRAKHRKEMNIKAKKWREEHKEEISKDRKNHYKNNKNVYKNRFLQTRYGITLADFNKILKNQQGKCAICKISQKRLPRAFAVDEVPEFKNTKNPIVRGLLCGNCNLLLGYAKDNIKILKSVIEYLKKHNNKRRKKNAKVR